jgi:hypothetical protein
MGAITPEELVMVKSRSTLGNKYDSPVNRDSAYEILSRRTLEKEKAESMKNGGELEKMSERKKGLFNDFLWGTRRRQGMVETMAKQAARTVGSQLGRRILRGVLGGIFRASSRS